MGRGDDGSCKRRKMNDASKKNGGGSSGACSSRGPPPRDVVPMDHVLATNAALRDRLASLGATRPSYVMEKRLKTSDVHRNQARLLFSCKSGLQCPLAACFTAAEARRVADMGDGLLVRALDRAGRSYDLKCKYLVSNHAYRFITGWKAFVQANGLALNGGDFRRDVRVELWAFRSRALPNRFVEKNKKKVYDYEETGDPDGALGLVLLHYENAVEHDGKDEAGMMAVAEEEPVTTPVTRQEDLLVGSSRRDATVVCPMTKDEIVAKYGEKIASAAIGMEMLRRDGARGCMDPKQVPSLAR